MLVVLIVLAVLHSVGGYPFADSFIAWASLHWFLTFLLCLFLA